MTPCLHIASLPPTEHLTTWKIPYQANYFIAVRSLDELYALARSPMYLDSSIPKIVLGKGANTLFSSNFIDGLIICIDLKGKTLLNEDEHHSYWNIMAGEDWCDLVDFFVHEQRLAGMENMVSIPGKVGSAAIQNIAAYGQGFEDICERVHCVDMRTGREHIFTKNECQFSYRNSFFKQEMLKGNRHFIITSVVLKLHKKFSPETSYESNYESLSAVLHRHHITQPTLQQVSNAIKELRASKLPDISQYGTNGSLFMNPIISGKELKPLMDKFPQLQFYNTEKMQHKKIPVSEIQAHSKYKIAAGHIFEVLQWRYKDEHQQWKAKIIDQVGVWHGHSLILVNYGTKNPKHIIHYIHLLQHSFQSHTGIPITPEINII